jgi:hypothetical protein
MVIAMWWLPTTCRVVSKVAFGKSLDPQGLCITHGERPSLFVPLRPGRLAVLALPRPILAWPGLALGGHGFVTRLDNRLRNDQQGVVHSPGGS